MVIACFTDADMGKKLQLAPETNNQSFGVTESKRERRPGSRRSTSGTKWPERQRGELRTASSPPTHLNEWRAEMALTSVRRPDFLLMDRS